MTHGSLFSGIGGFDLAAEWMGWDNVFHCEWNEFGQKVLKYYWPKAISYADITKTDFSIHRGTIDVLTGGFPCQPYSQAGKRKGKEDERHLWPEMLRAIKSIQPSWVVGENVRGLVNWDGGVVFHEVQTDLEAAGYEVFPFLLPAASVNAPHERYRIWFVAHAISDGYQSGRLGENRSTPSESKSIGDQREWIRRNVGGAFEQGVITDTASSRQSRKRGRGEKPYLSTDNETFGADIFGKIKGYGSERVVTEPNRTEFQSEWVGLADIFRSPGDYGTKTDTGSTGREELNTTDFAEKQGHSSRYAVEGWDNWPTQPPVCNGNDGLSSQLDGITFPKWRNESIKGGGNAIVPQVALQIFKTIEQYKLQTA